MKYIELIYKLDSHIIFSTQDVLIFDNDFDRRRLNEWQSKGYIKKIIKGYYIFSNKNIDEYILFLAANKIYSPSYVSLETALSFYNIIPEIVPTITSITTKKTNHFETHLGVFYYHSIKENLFTGYKLIQVKEMPLKIASLEKSIIDYFYIHPEINSKEIFNELRWDTDIILKEMNKVKFKRLMSLFSNSLKKRIFNCLNLENYAGI